MSKSIDTGTNQTAGDSSPYHIHLNATRYAAQVSRQKLYEIVDALQRSNEDLDKLFNITEVLTQYIRYQQMYI